jgi:oligopeptide/dipeptide ABC transporter ATP-binding protein
MADRIGVMYLGKLVELGSGTDIYARPTHPYTAGLLAAIPVPEPEIARARTKAGVSGELPSAVDRRPAAGSAPAARMSRTCAPRRSRSCAASARATSPPVISR